MKKLTNKRLISYLVDHKHIDMVSVSKTQIVCTVSAKFKPDEVSQLLADTGQDMPRMTSSEGMNYIVSHDIDTAGQWTKTFGKRSYRSIRRRRHSS